MIGKREIGRKMVKKSGAEIYGFGKKAVCKENPCKLP